MIKMLRRSAPAAQALTSKSFRVVLRLSADERDRLDAYCEENFALHALFRDAPGDAPGGAQVIWLATRDRPRTARHFGVPCAGSYRGCVWTRPVSGARGWCSRRTTPSAPPLRSVVKMLQHRSWKAPHGRRAREVPAMQMRKSSISRRAAAWGVPSRDSTSSW